MKLIYELSNGHTLESPELSEKSLNDIIDTFGKFINNKSEMSGGYVTDGVNIIDLTSIVAIRKV